MQAIAVSPEADGSSPRAARIHYLDWLRVIAIFAVFLYHSLHPFDLVDWHIKNAEQSMAVTVFLTFFGLWGMPFFFFIAGTGSWFALRRRTERQYISERFKRLLVPFVFGAILLMPIMLYLEWNHKTQAGAMTVSFQEFVLDRNVGFSPRWFGSLGYHLWFLGFLFCFALLTLPFFGWLRGAQGQRFISHSVGLCQRRGGILLFAAPFVLLQLLLRPFFLEVHDWADFFVQLSFFALGYFLFTDRGFAAAIRRDWKLILVAAVVSFAILLVLLAIGDPFAWSETPGIPEFYVVWFLVSLNAVFWTLIVLFIGMRFLDFTNHWLQYSQEAVLPFFVLHQPVIIVIAFYVVQWDVGIPIKIVCVTLGSFFVSLGLYELVIKRVGPLRVMCGMKSRPQKAARLRPA